MYTLGENTTRTCKKKKKRFFRHVKWFLSLVQDAIWISFYLFFFLEKMYTFVYSFKVTMVEIFFFPFLSFSEKVSNLHSTTALMLISAHLIVIKGFTSSYCVTLSRIARDSTVKSTPKTTHTTCIWCTLWMPKAREFTLWRRWPKTTRSPSLPTQPDSLQMTSTPDKEWLWRRDTIFYQTRGQ